MRPSSRARRCSSSSFSASNFVDRIVRMSSCRRQSSSADIIARYLYFTLDFPFNSCHAPANKIGVALGRNTTQLRYIVEFISTICRRHHRMTTCHSKSSPRALQHPCFNGVAIKLTSSQDRVCGSPRSGQPGQTLSRLVCGARDARAICAARLKRSFSSVPLATPSSATAGHRLAKQGNR